MRKWGMPILLAEEPDPKKFNDIISNLLEDAAQYGVSDPVILSGDQALRGMGWDDPKKLSELNIGYVMVWKRKDD